MIKKQFEPIFALLEENSNKKVSTILPQLVELMSRKTNTSGNDTCFLKDENNEVYAIYCYYHKKWELVSDVEYGTKKSTATGLNSMCKEGVSKWTKGQRVLKLAKEELLTKVMNGDIDVADIGQEQLKLEEESKVIIPREDGHGFDEVNDIVRD